MLQMAKRVPNVPVDVAIYDLIAPVFVEIRQQRPRTRHRRMQVAVDRSPERQLHRSSLR